jgi:glycosyltransferase involved in cell wall biosynthesis
MVETARLRIESAMPQLIQQLGGELIPSPDLRVQPGALDGVTIMRYAHVYRERASGGVEQYLRHLDRELLKRHRLTVVQMHLVTDNTNDAIEVESVGLGRILWVPVVIRQTESRFADLPGRINYISRTLHGNRLREGRSGAILSSMRSLLRHQGGHLRYKAAILSDRLLHLLAELEVDLLALHWLSYDTGALISHAIEANVPFVFVNHFDNARLSLPQMRKLVVNAAAIGAISERDIPADLRDRCVNLSDAVDTDFFTPQQARPVSLPFRSILLLPARIQAGKGHHDLMKATRILIARRFDLAVAFVGAVDSESLHQELRQSAMNMGLESRILFLGEKSVEEIRDWYALSKIVVLPSYSEGLGRVLLEAQAMKRPIVAYDCGGISEAILPDKTGFLVKPGNVKALADKISFLLENEEEALRFGEHGREFVSRQFSVSSLVQRHEAFYLSALSTARPKNNSAFARA